jgi:hypothetical protein
MPRTGQGLMLIPPSLSPPSNAFLPIQWSLYPSGTIFLTSAREMSTTAMALFSWRETYARRESSGTVMNSGSRSCATVAPPGVDTGTPPTISTRGP